MLRLKVMRLGRVAAALALISVAACGEETDPAGQAGLGDSTQQGSAQPASQSPVEQPVAGEAAVWNIDTERPPSPGDESFPALVERLGCNSGETGQVLAPEVVEEPDQVVITFTVVPRASGPASCPGNKPVPHEVVLAAPVGDRVLVDGACLSGSSVTTSHCLDGAERWPTADRE
jgi:hypothetical protein